MINKMLPKCCKFDLYDLIKKQMEIHQKKTAGLANFGYKRAELIQNEKKQQKIYQKYNKKRMMEQIKLE